MSEPDNLRQAKSFAETALQAMATHQVPPTPANFALWYTYATGLLPELNRTIDILTSKQQPFTEALCTELYSRFCDTGRHFNLLQETGDRLHYAVERVNHYVNTASGHASAFGKTLDQYSGELGGSADPEELRVLLSGLILETQRTAERNRSLEDQLHQSSDEIAELRHNLEVVRHEAMTDALTGIPNRKFFEARLAAAAHDATETGEPLSLLIADIDHFKQFNDTYGHQLGDQVLRLVARTLSDSVKGRDTPARYGGEEFAIVLPQTRLQDAVKLGDQIRQLVMRRRIIRRRTGDTFGTLTLSMGASCYRRGEPLIETIRRADAALYEAKRGGRNRVVAEDAVTTPLPSTPG
jgi:diguanylate cyclase